MNGAVAVPEQERAAVFTGVSFEAESVVVSKDGVRFRASHAMRQLPPEGALYGLDESVRFAAFAAERLQQWVHDRAAQAAVMTAVEVAARWRHWERLP